MPDRWEIHFKKTGSNKARRWHTSCSAFNQTLRIMKKTIITCLGVSVVVLTGIFYANRKHELPVNNPLAGAAPNSSGSLQSSPQLGSAIDSQASIVGNLPEPIPAQAPDPSSDSAAFVAPMAQTAGSSLQQVLIQPTSAASGSSAPRNEVVELLQTTDMTNPEARQNLVARMTQIEESRMDAVLEKAGQLGVPVRINEPGGKVSILHDFRGDQPLYRITNNKNAGISTGANLVQTTPYGLDGSGVKIGVWDAGSIRDTHLELKGRVSKKNPTTALDDHSTHVAGTIAATGVDASAKGMAPKSTVDSYDWDNDYAEMAASGAASADALASVSISNHSYGYGSTTSDMGRYEVEAQTVDALVWALPYYLPFWAAGNDQGYLNTWGGYQSITFNSLAKNIITIGAINDAVVAGVRSTAAGSMSTFSSWGPCDDGRIKPDLVANGVSVYSSTAGSDSAYDGTYSGTSMATPNAAGSAALLEQLYVNTFGQCPRASLLKALLIHTADDLGNPGPDYMFGWGLINVKAAADMILAQKASPSAPSIFENTLTSTQKSTTTTFTWDGVSPIRATLSWTDPAGTAESIADSRTPNLVHDLDLKITAPDGATDYWPYVMPFVGAWTSASMSAAATTGRNKVDNTEQVYIANPNRPGNYTITVSLEGQLTTNAQTYSLVVTGVSLITAPTPTPSPSPSPFPSPTPTNPSPTVNLSSPMSGTSMSLGARLTLAANASDLTSSGTRGVISRVEFYSGTTLLGIDTSAPYSIMWKPGMAGNYSITARATDNQGAVGTSASATVFVAAPLPVPRISSFSPTSGPVGTSIVINGTNLSAVTGVQCNGVNVPVWNPVSDTQISAIVPFGATTGPVRVSTSTASATSSSPFTVITSPASIVISQIYPGGGHWWSDFSNDYVELHNSGPTPVTLDGWSLQLSGDYSTKWAAIPLKGTIPAKGYYLVALAGSYYAYDLPTADAWGSYDLSAKQGKVALMRTTTALKVSSPLGLANLNDLVGYGNTNAYEGSYPAISPDRYFAIFRANAGDSDTNQNYYDFYWNYASPRNSATPITFRKKSLSPIHAF